MLREHCRDHLGRTGARDVDSRAHDAIDVVVHLVERGDEGGVSGGEHDRAVERHVFGVRRTQSGKHIAQRVHPRLDLDQLFARAPDRGQSRRLGLHDEAHLVATHRRRQTSHRHVAAEPFGRAALDERPRAAPRLGDAVGCETNQRLAHHRTRHAERRCKARLRGQAAADLKPLAIDDFDDRRVSPVSQTRFAGRALGRVGQGPHRPSIIGIAHTGKAAARR